MQHDQLRSTSLALLNRALALCKQWDREQTKSQQLFQSLSNVLAQQSATQQMNASMAKQHGFDPARLIHKQRLGFEKTMEQLSNAMDEFDSMASQWQRLERDANKHLCKTTAELTRRAQRTHPLPVSTESLVKVAEIPPDQVQHTVEQLCSVYQSEYAFKRTLFESIPSSCASTAQLDALADRWDKEPHLHSNVREQMAERLVLYKHVKNVLESDDYKF